VPGAVGEICSSLKERAQAGNEIARPIGNMARMAR
jgi:hypothetical protein